MIIKVVFVVFLLQLLQAIDSAGFTGQLDVDVTQMINGCSLNDYTNASAGDKTKLEDTMKQTIAGTAGVSVSDVKDFIVQTTTTPATPPATPVITITYTLQALNLVSYDYVNSQFQEEIKFGTFKNLLQMFANANSAPNCMLTASSGSITLISQIPTYAPTAMPTFAPTAFSASHFGYLVEKHTVVSAIIGSVLGVLLLWYGGWGIYHIVTWVQDYQERQINAHLDEVNLHNKRLHNKFVKNDTDKSPHTSKMRENFKKQFGSAPAEDRDLDDDSNVQLTNISMGGGAASRGGHVRTLATKLPPNGTVSPKRKGNYSNIHDKGDIESGRLDLSSHTRTGDAFNISSSPTPEKTMSTQDINYELSGGMGNFGDDKSNRHGDKGKGVKKGFGFVNDDGGMGSPSTSGNGGRRGR
jgi:hypothetical protein